MKESSSTGPRHRLGLGLNGDLAPRIFASHVKENVATSRFLQSNWGLRLLRNPLVVASASGLDQKISHVVNFFERLPGSSHDTAQRILGDPVFHPRLMG